LQQKSAQLCGLAAAQMISGYYDKALKKDYQQSLKKIAARMGGASGQEMKNLFENSGFWAVVFPGTLDHSKTGLFSEIDRGRPLIVMLRKESESHYVVVDGYDPNKNLIILNDPAQGPVALPMQRFKTAWERSGRFTLLAVPREDLAKQ
jgi:ABC-type bacteriocin/lantibiotic exporter with double-glycine peptidase domain